MEKFDAITTADLLEKGAKILERDGWIQNSYHDSAFWVCKYCGMTSAELGEKNPNPYECEYEKNPRTQHHLVFTPTQTGAHCAVGGMMAAAFESGLLEVTEMQEYASFLKATGQGYEIDEYGDKTEYGYLAQILREEVPFSDFPSLNDDPESSKETITGMMLRCAERLRSL
jgi:hypothetical protein